MSHDIRTLTPADIPAVRSLFLRLLQETFVEFPEQAKQHYAVQWQESVLETACTDPQRAMLLAVDGAKRPQAYLFGTGIEGGVATVVWLATAPEHRNRGLGRALLQAAERHYRDHHAHKLRLFTHNETALAFYTRLGWTCEGIHTDHWWRIRFWSLGLSLTGTR